MAKSIMIFGVSGNVGEYLVDYLSKTEEVKSGKFEIIGVDIRFSKYVKEHVKTYEVNINNKESLYSAIDEEDIYAIIDLVGPMPAKMNGYHPEEYVETNVLGTFNLAQYAVEKKVNRFLYARSFCDLSGWMNEKKNLTVGMNPKFAYDDQHSVYTVSQIAAAEFLRCIHEYYHLRTFIFRFPTVYCWNDRDYYSVDGVPQFKMWKKIVMDAVNGNDLEIWGDPSREKDMVYVKDVCQMIYRACFVDRDYGFYNVGTGVGITLEEQVKCIKEVFDDEDRCKIVYRPDKPSAPEYIMDISEAKEELGYQPQYSFKSMLIDMKKEKELNRF